MITTAERIAEIKAGRGRTAAPSAPPPNAFSLAAEKALQDLQSVTAQQAGINTNISGIASKTSDLVAKILPEIHSIANKQMGISDKQIAAAKDLFGQAKNISGIGKGIVDKGQGLVDRYGNTFQPLEERVAKLAMEGVTPDYEGTRGRAAADVNSAYEVAKQNQLREMGDQGLSPDAGQYDTLNRNLNLEQAKSKALAVGQAGRDETNRVETQNFGRAVQGLGAGQNLLTSGVNQQQVGAGIMGTGANVTASGAGILGNAGAGLSNTAKTYSDLAGAYAPVLNAYGTASNALTNTANINSGIFKTTAELGMQQSAAQKAQNTVAENRKKLANTLTGIGVGTDMGGGWTSNNTEGSIKNALLQYDLQNPQ